MQRCLLKLLSTADIIENEHISISKQSGIPSTNVTFIAQNCSTELSFNSLDALHQI